MRKDDLKCTYLETETEDHLRGKKYGGTGLFSEENGNFVCRT